MDREENPRVTVDAVANEWARKLLAGRVVCIDDLVVGLGISENLARRGLQRLLDNGAFPEPLGHQCVVLERNHLRASEVSIGDLLELQTLPDELGNLVAIVALHSVPFERRYYRLRRDHREEELIERPRRSNGAKALKARLLARH